MATLVEQFLKSEGINLNPLEQILEESRLAELSEERDPVIASNVETAQGRVLGKIEQQLLDGETVRFPDGSFQKLEYDESMGESKEYWANIGAQEYTRQLEEQTGFGDTFAYYAMEPILGLAEALENIGMFDINLDEEKAQFFKDSAEVASADNPVLGTVAMLAGSATALGTAALTRAGTVAARGVAALGGGTTAQLATSGAVSGGLYGSLIPELEQGTNRGANIALGAVGGGIALPALRGINIAMRQAAARRAEREMAGIAAVDQTVQPAPADPKTNVGKAMQYVGNGVDYVLGTLHTRIAALSQPIANKLRRFEFESKERTTALYKESAPLVEGFLKITGKSKDDLSMALFNRRFDIAENIIKREAPDLLPEFRKVQAKINDIKEQLILAKYDLEDAPAGYWPRLVKDYQGLMNKLGANERTQINTALRERAAKENLSVEQLDPLVRTQVINGVLKTPIQGKVSIKASSYGKGRVIDDVTEELLPYYATPEESLEFFYRSASHNLAKARFFGAMDDPTSMANSVGKLIDEERASGRLSDKQIDILSGMLQSRFIQGERSPNAFFKAVREVGYATTIANPLSALVQLGDTASAAIMHGLRNTIAAMFGKKTIKLDTVGMQDRIVQELEDTSGMLNKLFRWSGFKAIDKFGKETLLNAAYRKSVAMTSTEAGRNAFRKKYGKVFGDEIEGLMEDLQAGNISDNVKFHMFNELSDVQPISLSEVPQGYLDNPNSGRVAYMLKTFTLKQYDLIRKNIIQEAKRGNIGAATTYAIRYAAYMSIMNGTIQTIRDGLQGRITSTDEAIEVFPDAMLWEGLSVLGFNKYMSERYLGGGDLRGLVGSVLIPPTPLADAAFKEFSDMFAGSESSREAAIEPILKSTPIVGPALPLLAMWYNFMFGGFEEYLKKQDDKNK
jgi:hypothetical protein